MIIEVEESLTYFLMLNNTKGLIETVLPQSDEPES